MQEALILAMKAPPEELKRKSGADDRRAAEQTALPTARRKSRESVPPVALGAVHGAVAKAELANEDVQPEVERCGLQPRRRGRCAGVCGSR